MALFICPLISHPATPLKSSPRKQFSQVSKMERWSFSSLLQQGNGVLLGGNKNANNWIFFFFFLIAEYSKLCLLMPGTVRERHQWNLSHILSTQQDHLLGCLLAPAVRSLISTLLRLRPDGRGNLPHLHDLPGTEEVTSRVLPFLMPHGRVSDLDLVITGFKARHDSFNVGLLGESPLDLWMPSLPYPNQKS